LAALQTQKRVRNVILCFYACLIGLPKRRLPWTLYEIRAKISWI